MKRTASAKFLAATAVALGAFVAASAAHARTDVYFSIGMPAPVYVQPAPVYVQPAPVYVQPAPVYVQPRPVYVEPRPVYVAPRPVYIAPRPVYVAPRPVYVQPQPVYVPAPTYYGHGYGRHYGPYGDLDRDGIRNRHDRFPGDRYRY